MQQFKLDGSEYIPLCDLLKSSGLCDTGGQAKVMITEGEVTVDGQVETRKRCKIRAGQVVSLSGEEIEVVP